MIIMARSAIEIPKVASAVRKKPSFSYEGTGIFHAGDSLRTDNI